MHTHITRLYYVYKKLNTSYYAKSKIKLIYIYLYILLMTERPNHYIAFGILKYIIHNVTFIKRRIFSCIKRLDSKSLDRQ